MILYTVDVVVQNGSYLIGMIAFCEIVSLHCVNC